MELPTNLLYAEKVPDGPAQALVILLHGYGADEYDLLDLGADMPPGTALVCLSAPGTIPMGGRSWFDLHWHGDSYEPDLVGARAVIPLVIQDAQRHKARFDDVPTILGGFSQGAMTSMIVALSGELTLAGLWLMSGALLGPLVPATPAPLPPTLCQHGTQDQTVTIERGRELAAAAQKYASQATILEYPMAHTISPPSYADAMSWLQVAIEQRVGRLNRI